MRRKSVSGLVGAIIARGQEWPGRQWWQFPVGNLAALICIVLLLAHFSFAPAATGDDAAQSIVAEQLSDDELELVRAVERARIEAISRVRPSVVAIYDEQHGGGGSGVIVEPGGLAVTNHHVVAAAGVSGWAGLDDGNLYKWHLVATDPGGDVAVIQLEGRDDFVWSPLADSDDVRVGQWVMAIGNPFLLAEDQTPTVTLGVVSGIERYQGGMPGNLLVYGNCIQVDSSINPGNSGGPLFDLQGRVIGINGRGSFQDRGRVNVGLGYAISINQVKNFVPELLATRLVRHGTLDATFADSEQGVICSSINIDAPIAQAGLRLGDRIAEFEGYEIEHVHRLTNLLTIYPEGWPVHMVAINDRGQRVDLHTRLLGLPYGRLVPGPPPEPPPPPGSDDSDEVPPDDSDELEPPDEAQRQSAAEPPSDAPPRPPLPAQPSDDADSEAAPSPQPEEPPAPAPPGTPAPQPTMNPMMAFLQTPPGAIRDLEMNQRHARLILNRLIAATRGVAPVSNDTVLMVEDQILDRRGEFIGEQRMWLALDGRFRVETSDERGKTVYTYDGQELVRRSGQRRDVLTWGTAALDPVALQALLIPATWSEPPLAEREVTIDGSDRAVGHRAFRLRVQDGPRDWFFIWLGERESALSPFETQLSKASAYLDCDGRAGGVAFEAWQATPAGVEFPVRRSLVRGLAETEERAWQTISLQVQTDTPSDYFSDYEGE